MIRRLIALIALAAGTSLFGGCAYYNTMYHADTAYDQAQTEVRKSRETGQSKANVGLNNFNTCIEKCQKMLDIHGGSKWADDAHFLMGKAYYGKGDYLSARRQFQRFRGRYPNSELNPAVLFWGGLTDLALGEPDVARETWHELIEKYPDYEGREEVEFHLAEVLKEEQRYAEAAEAYASFLEVHPKDARSTAARLSLGEVLLEEGRHEESAAVFEEVSRRARNERDRVQAQLNLGKVYEADQRFEDALAIYNDLEYTFDPSYLDGRITPEEREAYLAAEQELIAQARADSAFNATFLSEEAEEAARAGDSNTQDPDDLFATTNPDGSITNADGSITNRDGTITHPDGSVTNRNGTTTHPDGTVTNPDGSLVDPNAPATQSLQSSGAPQGQVQGATEQARQLMQSMGRTPLPRTDPHYEDLARVIIREGRALAAMGKSWEAILAFDQVIAEYPTTEFAAEAQFRIGYTHEVELEDYAEAEKAYRAVATQLRTSAFTADAENRARTLNTVQTVTAADTTGASRSQDVDARFVRAELYLYQQDKPQKAIEEYLALQKEFAGTEVAAKAALAEAYLRFHVQADTARGRAKYAEVMTRFPDTRYGHFAHRLLRGPEREPKEAEFVGPSLKLLLADANLEAIAKENAAIAALNAPPETAAVDSSVTGPATSEAGVVAGGFLNPFGGLSGESINPLVPPRDGPSPILTDAERSGSGRRRVVAGFVPDARPAAPAVTEDAARAFMDSLLSVRDSVQVATGDTLQSRPDTSAVNPRRGPRAGPWTRPTPAPADSTGTDDGGR